MSPLKNVISAANLVATLACAVSFKQEFKRLKVTDTFNVPTYAKQKRKAQWKSETGRAVR